MKKALITTGAILGMISSAMANETFSSDKFVGVEVMQSEVQGAIPDNNAYTQDGLSYGIKLGAQNERWRTSVIYNLFDKGMQNIEALNLLVDYFLYPEDKGMMFRPYMGVNVGYASYESLNIEETGFTYGMQGGVSATIMPKVDVDLSYRYTVSGMDRYDHNTGFVLGLHYFY